MPVAHEAGRQASYFLQSRRTGGAKTVEVVVDVKSW